MCNFLMPLLRAKISLMIAQEKPLRALSSWYIIAAAAESSHMIRNQRQFEDYFLSYNALDTPFHFIVTERPFKRPHPG